MNLAEFNTSPPLFDYDRTLHWDQETEANGAFRPQILDALTTATGPVLITSTPDMNPLMTLFAVLADTGNKTVTLASPADGVLNLTYQAGRIVTNDKDVTLILDETHLLDDVTDNYRTRWLDAMRPLAALPQVKHLFVMVTLTDAPVLTN